MDYEKYRFWIESAWLLANVWLLVWTYWSNKQKATVAEIKGLREMIEAAQKSQAGQCGEHKSRTTTLEVQFQGAPTHRDIGAVYDRISDLKSSVDKMYGALNGVSHQIQLLMDHHLNGGGKA